MNMLYISTVAVVIVLHFVRMSLLHTYNVHFIMCKLYVVQNDLKKGTNHWHVKQNKWLSNVRRHKKNPDTKKDILSESTVDRSQDLGHLGGGWELAG